MTIRYNVVSKKTYQKDGAEKAAWLQVGQLIRFDATPDKPEQFSLELNMFPMQKFYVFAPKPKVETPPAQAQPEDDQIPF
jgi:hypothetical protein